MPTYNYYCNNCDSHFSYFQKMSEVSISKCEECGSKIERIITGGSGLIFKGTGFYLTDYKDGKKKSNPDEKKNKKTSEKSEKDNISKSAKTNNQSQSKKIEKKDE